MQQIPLESSPTIFSIFVQVLVPILSFLIGWFTASRQVREAARSYQASVLIQLTQEWNNMEIYAAVGYIHNLRKKWKEDTPDYKNWSKLAQKWVDEHAPSKSISDERLAEWNKRRMVSQLVSKMGYMMSAGYIKSDDFFAIVPEVMRLLMVLEPIERCIAQHFKELEVQAEDWDRPFGKTGFEGIEDKYSTWFAIKGREHLSKLDNA